MGIITKEEYVADRIEYCKERLQDLKDDLMDGFNSLPGIMVVVRAVALTEKYFNVKRFNSLPGIMVVVSITRPTL